MASIYKMLMSSEVNDNKKAMKLISEIVDQTRIVWDVTRHTNAPKDRFYYHIMSRAKRVTQAMFWFYYSMKYSPDQGRLEGYYYALNVMLNNQ